MENNKNSKTTDHKNTNKMDENNLYYRDLLPTGTSQVTEDFLLKIFKLMIRHINRSNDRNEKVI
jgi:hypothetical protein